MYCRTVAHARLGPHTLRRQLSSATPALSNAAAPPDGPSASSSTASAPEPSSASPSSPSPPARAGVGRGRGKGPLTIGGATVDIVELTRRSLDMAELRRQGRLGDVGNANARAAASGNVAPDSSSYNNRSRGGVRNGHRRPPRRDKAKEEGALSAALARGQFDDAIEGDNQNPAETTTTTDGAKGQKPKGRRSRLSSRLTGAEGDEATYADLIQMDTPIVGGGGPRSRGGFARGGGGARANSPVRRDGYGRGAQRDGYGRGAQRDGYGRGAQRNGPGRGGASAGGPRGGRGGRPQSQPRRFRDAPSNDMLRGLRKVEPTEPVDASKLPDITTSTPWPSASSMISWWPHPRLAPLHADAGTEERLQDLAERRGGDYSVYQAANHRGERQDDHEVVQTADVALSQNPSVFPRDRKFVLAMIAKGVGQAPSAAGDKQVSAK